MRDTEGFTAPRPQKTMVISCKQVWLPAKYSIDLYGTPNTRFRNCIHSFMATLKLFMAATVIYCRNKLVLSKNKCWRFFKFHYIMTVFATVLVLHIVPHSIAEILTVIVKWHTPLWNKAYRWGRNWSYIILDEIYVSTNHSLINKFVCKPTAITWRL